MSLASIELRVHICVYTTLTIPDGRIATTYGSLTTSGIILGTHREKGAHTFWSYALGLSLASSSVLSWKFCHVLHKVLRDGHVNVRSPLFGSIDLNPRFV